MLWDIDITTMRMPSIQRFQREPNHDFKSLQKKQDSGLNVRTKETYVADCLFSKREAYQTLTFCFKPKNAKKHLKKVRDEGPTDSSVWPKGSDERAGDES